MSYPATFIGQDHMPHTIQLPTSFVEFRQRGLREMYHSVVHHFPHVKYHISTMDKTQWLKENFSNFETLRRSLLTAAFILSPLTSIAVLFQLTALIGNVIGIFKSSFSQLFQPSAQKHDYLAILARHEKYNFTGNVLKFGLFIGLPSGLFGLLIYASAWSMIDTICQKAEILDNSKATDMDPTPLLQAMNGAISAVLQDWCDDIYQAFDLNTHIDARDLSHSTSGWATHSP